MGRGGLLASCLPPALCLLPLPCINIQYLSSTHTDMTMEKSEIVNEICPQLKRYCM